MIANLQSTVSLLVLAVCVHGTIIEPECSKEPLQAVVSYTLYIYRNFFFYNIFFLLFSIQVVVVVHLIFYPKKLLINVLQWKHRSNQNLLHQHKYQSQCCFQPAYALSHFLILFLLFSYLYFYVTVSGYMYF